MLQGNNFMKRFQLDFLRDSLHRRHGSGVVKNWFPNLGYGQACEEVIRNHALEVNRPIGYPGRDRLALHPHLACPIPLGASAFHPLRREEWLP